MAKGTILILLMLFCFSARSQECDGAFYRATTDSVYYSNLVKYLHKNVGWKSPGGSTPQWTNSCNSPRKLVFQYKIKVLCSGEIIEFKAEKVELQCVNERKELIKIPFANNPYSIDIVNQHKKELMCLAKLEPLKINGKSVNTEISYPFIWGL